MTGPLCEYKPVEGDVISIENGLTGIVGCVDRHSEEFYIFQDKNAGARPPLHSPQPEAYGLKNSYRHRFGAKALGDKRKVQILCPSERRDLPTSPIPVPNYHPIIGDEVEIIANDTGLSEVKGVVGAIVLNSIDFQPIYFFIFQDTREGAYPNKSYPQPGDMGKRYSWIINSNESYLSIRIFYKPIATKGGQMGASQRKAPAPDSGNSPEWELLDAVLGASSRVAVSGPPGVGKTFASMHAGLNGRKVYAVTVTPDTSAAELRGHYMLKGNEMVWHDGLGVRAWREGGRLVVNELKDASGDVLTFCHALFDDPVFAEIALPTGEVVKPQEGFQAVVTMNGDISELPPALRDRFPVSIAVTEVAPGAIHSLPEELRAAAQELALIEDEERRVSVRAWLEFVNLREKLGEEVAAHAVFGKRAGELITALKVYREKANG